MRRVDAPAFLATPGEEVRSGGKVLVFFSLRRLLALSTRLDVGRWSRALSLIGSPEQTHQLTSSPSGRGADASSSPSGSPQSFDIIWLCWFFSG